MTEREREQELRSRSIINKVISLTLQNIYNSSANWKWKSDEKLLGIYKEVESIIETDLFIPEFVLKEDRGTNIEQFSVLRDFLRLGIILYQSNHLTYSYTHETTRASSFEFTPPEIPLLTTTRYHLSKLNKSIGNLDYVNILISQLKFERFLVAFLLRNPGSIHFSFTSYRKENCTEHDRLFQSQILDILTEFHNTDWYSLATHLKKVLLHLQNTRQLLTSRLINDFLHANSHSILTVIMAYHSLIESTPFVIPDIFYYICKNAAIDPLSRVDISTHPDTVIHKLNSVLDMKERSEENREYLIDNFLFSNTLSCNISTEEANKVISKYAKSDTLNESFTPEVDQGSSFDGLIDFFLQLTSEPDEVISFLKLICSKTYPSIDFLQFSN